MERYFPKFWHLGREMRTGIRSIGSMMFYTLRHRALGWHLPHVYTPSMKFIQDIQLVCGCLVLFQSYNLPKSCYILFVFIHAYPCFYIKNIFILIYTVIGSSISDITRNRYTLYIHFISTVLVMSNNMCDFTLIIVLLHCVVILQMCIVYLY